MGEELGDFFYNLNEHYISKEKIGQIMNINSTDTMTGNSSNLNIGDVDISDISVVLDSLDVLTGSTSIEDSPESDSSTTSSPDSKDQEQSSETNEGPQKPKRTCTYKTRTEITGKTVYSGPSVGPVRGTFDSRNLFPRYPGYAEQVLQLSTKIEKLTNCEIKITYTEVVQNRVNKGQWYRQPDWRGWNKKTYGNDEDIKRDLSKLVD